MEDAAGGGPPYHLAFAISADAAIDGARLAMAPLRRRMTILALGAIVAGVALSLVGEWSFGPMLAFLGLLILGMTTLRGPERWLIRRRARSVLGGTAELVFGETGVDFRSPQASGRIPWSALTGVREDTHTVILVRDRILATYVPTAAFGSPERRAEVVAYARERIATAATTRSLPS